MSEQTELETYLNPTERLDRPIVIWESVDVRLVLAGKQVVCETRDADAMRQPRWRRYDASWCITKMLTELARKAISEQTETP